MSLVRCGTAYAQTTKHMFKKVTHRCPDLAMFVRAETSHANPKSLASICAVEGSQKFFDTIVQIVSVCACRNLACESKSLATFNGRSTRSWKMEQNLSTSVVKVRPLFYFYFSLTPALVQLAEKKIVNHTDYERVHRVWYSKHEALTNTSATLQNALQNAKHACVLHVCFVSPWMV